jgi:hypothetical protein
MPQGRLAIDPSTLLPSIRTFGELGTFLRSADADDESREFGASMGVLATHIEAIVASLRLSRERDAVAPLLVDFLTVLRGHRGLVIGLGTPWRSLYEYPAYLAVLNNFRVLIGQWLLDGGTHREILGLTAEDFELVAWRTLAEGMLLIDMYEQHVCSAEQQESAMAALEEPRVERALAWWQKIKL